MRIARLNNVHLHWREDGAPDGDPIVFANSLGTDLRLWDDVVALLPPGLRIIRFDKRGHGLSSGPDGDWTIEDVCEDLIELLDQLDVQDCLFVGVSIGGMIGQLLAAKRPDLVRALVLSNTAAKMGEPAMWEARIADLRAGGLEPMADAIMERWFSPGFRQTPELTGWRNMLTATPLAGYIGCCQAIAGADLTDLAVLITQPAMVVAGTEDLASPVSVVTEFSELLSDAELVVLEGVGHLPGAEVPETFSKYLNDFIGRNARV